MRTLSPEGTALINGKNIALCYLVRMETYLTPIVLNSGGWDLTFDDGIHGPEEYLALGQFVSIQEITDTSSELTSMNFSITITDAALSLALSDSALMRGKEVVLRTALIDLDNFGIVDAPIEWAGKIDNFKIQQSEGSAVVTATCETYALDLIRPHSSMYTTNDQQKLYPNDLGFEFIKDADTPIVWPTAAFLKKL